MRTFLLIATLTLAQAQPGYGQMAPFTCWIRGPADKLAERPSPLDSISVQLGGGTVKLCYGRPSARGRKVMGELVPFDQPWRLGANEATTIHLPFAAQLAGVRLEPGTYTLGAGDLHAIRDSRRIEMADRGQPWRSALGRSHRQ